MHKNILCMICLTSISPLFLSACVSQQTDINHSTQLTTAAELNAQLGLAYLQENKIQLAQEKLLLAQKQNSTNAHVLLALAYFFQQTGRPALAKENYQKALEHAANNPEILNDYGAFLCQEGQYAKAMQFFDEAQQEVNYVHMDAVEENAGLCAYLNNKLPLAKKFFQQALAINPERGLAREMLAELDSHN